MKKIGRVILAVIVVLCSVVPSSSVTATEKGLNEWHDIYLSQEIFNSIVETKSSDTRVTGLISTYALGIKKDGNQLIIAGSTDCFGDVVKCGFKEVVIQRRANSTQPWTDYVTYEDLYDNDFSYLLSKSITVGTGYQYRVTAVHYAKKNIFMTQKLDNVSNVVTM
ncbi:MAG: hypothetical protein IJC79_00815 [Clostridia bacterium]|nr:hypothetical protein [Clostridia bacterium]